MSKKLIVLLISEQTVPNIQFLKWFFKNNLQTVDLLFISTQKMEAKGKTEHTKNALSYLEKYIEEQKTICVDENSINDIKEKTDKLISTWEHDSYTVSITGGTKIMSLSTFDYFRNKANCEIFYQPLNQNLQRIFPCYEEFSVSEILDLEEYMKAHGIQFKFDNNCTRDYDYNSTVYKSVIEQNRESIKPIIAMQNNSYFSNIFKRKDKIDFELIPEDKFKTPEGSLISKETVCDTILKFGFDIKTISREELRYITGGWFEEYVFQKTKRDLKLSDGNIALNVSIEKDGVKNELDVVYIKENRLNVIECKSFLDGKEGNKVLNDALYKLQAIMKSKFGLNSKPYLYTQSIITKNTVLDRAKDFGIELVDGSVL